MIVENRRPEMETGDLFSHFASIREVEEPERIDWNEGFEYWKQQPGARQVLRRCYARAAYWSSRWRRTGIPISIKLIWEEVRQEIKEGRIRAKRRGVELKNYGGYRLNNNLTAPLARHIIEHKPEWAGMFETRERKGD